MSGLETANRRETSAVEVGRHIVMHMRQNRAALLDEWVRRIASNRLLLTMTPEEVRAGTESIYDSYVEALETGTLQALQAYARNLSARTVLWGVELNEIVGSILLLRNVLARWLFTRYRDHFELLDGVLDAYEPAAVRGANTAKLDFKQKRERVIHRQQQAIVELSTPVFAMVQLGLELTDITTSLDLEDAIARLHAQHGQSGALNADRPSTRYN